jgi:CXXX repeat peptide maturase
MASRKNSRRHKPAEGDDLRPAHLIVLADRSAVAFCHDDNPYTEPSWMDARLLRALIAKAEARAMALTFVLGATKPPPEIQRLIDSTEHAEIAPAAHSGRGAIAVVESGDDSALQNLTPDVSRNLILRLARRDLSRFADIGKALTGRYGRLSIHLNGIEYYTSANLALYAAQLGGFAEELRLRIGEGYRLEVNVLTDRMMLKDMRNCDAGVSHVTVTPDGGCYICPAFYYDGEDPIGRFDAKKGFTIGKHDNLERARGPLCRRCDAFHCKRCVWLNRKTTGEDNVPSAQQCAIAHIERDASRRLLQNLGTQEPFWRLPRIAELAYRDPLELITGPD